MSYGCIPEWQQPTQNDPFDYQLRSKDEVTHEFKYFNDAAFNVHVQYKKYTAGDTRVEDNLDNRERIVSIKAHA